MSNNDIQLGTVQLSKSGKKYLDIFQSINDNAPHGRGHIYAVDNQGIRWYCIKKKDSNNTPLQDLAGNYDIMKMPLSSRGMKFQYKMLNKKRLVITLNQDGTPEAIA